jgi:hypothetical protein
VWAALVVSPAAVPVAHAVSPPPPPILLPVAPAATDLWSAPARPAGCAAALSSAAAPLIVFPSSDPEARSGPGALVWTAPRGCRVGGGEALGSPLGEDDLPGPSRPLTAGAGDLVGIAAATGTALGQVVVAGAGAGASGALVEGSMVGSLRPAGSLDGPSAPLAAFSAFLGDAVVVSPAHRRTGWDLAVRVQRHYSDTLAAPLLLPAGPGQPSALTATMDYRGDILAVWAAGDGVYVREIGQSGAVGPAHRLGSSSPDPELQALISDDGRAMVAWRSQTALPGGGARTSIELSISDPATSFGRPSAVERFEDPPGLVPPPGSLHLVRLSSEAVMMAWTGMQGGRYVVRASPVSLRRGAWAPVTISDTDTDTGAADAMLADLVPGPHAEALALWTSGPRLPAGALDPTRRMILAARGHFAGPGRVAFGPPETVAPPGRNGAPAAAFDPRSDRALAAWVTRAGSPRIAYSLRGDEQQAPAEAPTGARSTPVGPLSIVLFAGAALLLVGAAAWLAVARRPAGGVRSHRG